MSSISNLDEEKFTELYERMMPKLLHFAFRWCSDKSLAQDAVQEAFSTLWNKRTQIRYEGQVEQLLYTMVRNQLINVYQRKLKEQRIISEIPRLDPSEPDWDEQTLQRVNAGIEQLPPRCKEIFLMSKKAGMTYPEIASELSISVKSVEKQISRALKKLRHHLKQAYSNFF